MIIIWDLSQELIILEYSSVTPEKCWDIRLNQTIVAFFRNISNWQSFQAAGLEAKFLRIHFNKLQITKK
jgi:hypothetical protein